MAYNEKLADRIREALADVPKVEEKKMFSGVCFMVNGKMCICVRKTDIMCRIDPALTETVVEKNGCAQMVMKGKSMKGYVTVDEDVLKNKKDLQYWIDLALAFNEKAKASPKKNKKKRTA